MYDYVDIFLDLMELSFAKHLEEFGCSRQKREKKDRDIRYFHYRVWARECLKNDIGPQKAQHGYLESVLSFIKKKPWRYC